MSTRPALERPRHPPPAQIGTPFMTYLSAESGPCGGGRPSKQISSFLRSGSPKQLLELLQRFLKPLRILQYAGKQIARLRETLRSVVDIELARREARLHFAP